MTTHWFTGIELPPDTAATVAALRSPVHGVRWAQPESYHITLRYLGEVDETTLTQFMDRARHVDTAAFSIAVAGVGAFGGSRPSVIWAGVAESPSLRAVATAHDDAARAVGLAADAHQHYVPHITIGRAGKPDATQVADFLAANADFVTEPFTVSRWVLFASRPDRNGGAYDPVAALPLL